MLVSINCPDQVTSALFTDHLVSELHARSPKEAQPIFHDKSLPPLTASDLRTVEFIEHARNTGYLISGDFDRKVDLENLEIMAFRAKGFKSYLRQCPMQDALAVSIHGNSCCGAIADGVSGDDPTDIGAKFLSSRAADIGAELADNYKGLLFDKEFLDSYFLAIFQELKNFAHRAGFDFTTAASEILESTLLITIVRPNDSIVLSVGDGSLYLGEQSLNVLDAAKGSALLKAWNCPPRLSEVLIGYASPSTRIHPSKWRSDDELFQLASEIGNLNLASNLIKIELGSRAAFLSKGFTIVLHAPTYRFLRHGADIASDGEAYVRGADFPKKFPLNKALETVGPNLAEELLFLYQLATAYYQENNVPEVLKPNTKCLALNFLVQQFAGGREFILLDPWLEKLPESYRAVFNQITACTDMNQGFGILEVMPVQMQEELAFALTDSAVSILNSYFGTSEVIDPKILAKFAIVMDDVSKISFKINQKN